LEERTVAHVGRLRTLCNSFCGTTDSVRDKDLWLVASCLKQHAEMTVLGFGYPFSTAMNPVRKQSFHMDLAYMWDKLRMDICLLDGPLALVH
jgi:hypothetical protein